MALTLYGIPESRAIRPLWAACELGLEFEHVPVPCEGGAPRSPECLAINPNGRIPALLDARDDRPVVVWESMACALYLARVHGVPDGASIAPASPREEAGALRWSFWTVNELERDALTVLMHRVAMPEARRRPVLAEQAGRRLAPPLTVLEAHLRAQQARGEAHLAAARFTVADLCVASVANWVRAAGMPLAEWPAVVGWLDACMDRPAYRAARALGRG
ncbi:MAG: glutathione S-transferase family protein [Burkholderiales bacterium]|nr:glutathione S-transferase family protein [Burkholderiales bacterium]